MDTEKDINEYKSEWVAKVEEDSTNLFKVALNAVEKYPKMKVVIVKRLPRFDPISSEPKGIKQQLSKFAKHVYDKLWFKKGCVKNILLIDFDLKCSSSGYLKGLIDTKHNERKYDDIHLRGEGATHISHTKLPVQLSRGEKLPVDYHNNCPQTKFQLQSQQAPQTGRPGNSS